MPETSSSAIFPSSLTPRLFRRAERAHPCPGGVPGEFLVGILPGEGIGPEVIAAALQVLAAVEAVSSCRFDLQYGGPIGLAAEAQGGCALSEEVAGFCHEIFGNGGPVLAGPGGGRFVYDLRARFDLFCKLSPVRVPDALVTACPVRPDLVRGADLMIVRENTGGVYQGRSEETIAPDGKTVSHTFTYSGAQVERLMTVAARIARRRRREMTVVVKDGGLPAMTQLWCDGGVRAAAAYEVRCRFVNIDLAAYQLIQEPKAFDVLVAPNLFGDILIDLAAVLLGGRGNSFSGNFSAEGAAVYQTNHGAAYDLAGADQANPVGQIYSLAMMLRESFGLWREAGLVEAAVEAVWSEGWRTADLAGPSSRAAGSPPPDRLVVGTTEMAARIAEAVVELGSGVAGHRAADQPRNGSRVIGDEASAPAD